MSHKETYAEYTKTFPCMMQKFRAQPPEVEGVRRFRGLSTGERDPYR